MTQAPGQEFERTSASVSTISRPKLNPAHVALNIVLVVVVVIMVAVLSALVLYPPHPCGKLSYTYACPGRELTIPVGGAAYNIVPINESSNFVFVGGFTATNATSVFIANSSLFNTTGLFASAWYLFNSTGASFVIPVTAGAWVVVFVAYNSAQSDTITFTQPTGVL